MSTTQALRFDHTTWNMGTRGRLHPSNTSQPRLTNVRVRRDGLIVRRPRWVEGFDLDAGISTGASTRVFAGVYDYGESGVPTDLGGIIAFDTADIHYYTMPTGTLDGDDTATLSLTEGKTINKVGSSAYLVGNTLIESSGPNPSTPKQMSGTVANIAFAFGLSSFTVFGSEIHRGRAYYWGAGDGLSNRIYYSDSFVALADLVTFTSSSQQFDVDFAVEAIVSVGPTLWIACTNGLWYSLQVVGDPSTGTLTPYVYGRPPLHKPAVIDRKAFFRTKDYESIGVLGGEGQVDDHSLINLGDNDRSVGNFQPPPPAATSANDALLIPKTNFAGADHMYLDVWTEDVWDLPTMATVPNPYFSYSERADKQLAREILAVVQDGASVFTVFYRDLEEEVVEAGDTVAETTVTAEVRLPRIFTPSKQVRVKRVFVDVSEVDPSTAAMTVKVEDGKGNNPTLTIGPGTDPLGTASADDHLRLVFTGAPTAYSHFSDVVLTGFEGLAVEGVTVEFEISEGLVQ